jgi:hypothetical protein
MSIVSSSGCTGLMVTGNGVGSSVGGGFVSADARHYMELVEAIPLLDVNLLQVSDHHAQLFDQGAQDVVQLLRNGGHGDENRGGTGGMWATAASMVGGSGYQVVMVLIGGGQI